MDILVLSRFVLDKNWSNIEHMEITQEKSMNLEESEPRHPIQVVARRSGLSAPSRTDILSLP